MNRNSTLKRTQIARKTDAARLRQRRAMQAKPDLELVKWSKAVRRRDSYTCQRCGRHSIYNHAHHIATRRRRPDLKYEVSNGTTLCFDCHVWVHDYPKLACKLGLLSTATYEAAMKEDAA